MRLRCTQRAVESIVSVIERAQDDQLHALEQTLYNLHEFVKYRLKARNSQSNQELRAYNEVAADYREKLMGK